MTTPPNTGLGAYSRHASSLRIGVGIPERVALAGVQAGWLWLTLGLSR